MRPIHIQPRISNSIPLKTKLDLDTEFFLVATQKASYSQTELDYIPTRKFFLRRTPMTKEELAEMTNEDLDSRIRMLKHLEELENDDTRDMSNEDLDSRIRMLKELEELESD